jgi:hypothetical protein
MAVKIHGHYVTPGSRRVLVIAKECNIPYEFVPVDLWGKEHQRPPYIEHQPFGQVPYIVRHFLSQSPHPPPPYPLGAWAMVIIIVATDTLRFSFFFC